MLLALWGLFFTFHLFPAGSFFIADGFGIAHWWSIPSIITTLLVWILVFVVGAALVDKSTN